MLLGQAECRGEGCEWVSVRGWPRQCVSGRGIAGNTGARPVGTSVSCHGTPVIEEGDRLMKTARVASGREHDGRVAACGEGQSPSVC